jgi:hypothetical protein
MRRSVPRGADAPNIGQRWLKYTGLPAGPALEGAWTSAMHAHDGERVAEYWREIVAGGAAGEIEARLRRYDALARES